MKLWGNLKKEVDNISTKEGKKEAIKKAGMLLNDGELEQVTGGFGHRRSYCGCLVPMPDGNGYCEQCGCEILE